MQSTKVFPSISISYKSDEQLAQQCISQISQYESGLQGGLEELYMSMSNETFRAMRRIMPISRTKMDWNINAVRMVRQVRK